MALVSSVERGIFLGSNRSSETWTLFGADVDLQGVNAQMNVYFGETKVDYNTTAQGWVSGEYTLKYTDDTGLVMSRAGLA